MIRFILGFILVVYLLGIAFQSIFIVAIWYVDPLTFRSIRSKILFRCILWPPIVIIEFIVTTIDFIKCMRNGK